MNRRSLLRLTSTAAAATVLSSCTANEIHPDPAYRLFLTTEAGVSVLDQAGRVVAGPIAVPAATADWDRAVVATPQGPDTRIAVRELASGRVLSEHLLSGQLAPRIISASGELIASVPPGGAGIYGLHNPGGRDRTTVVVSHADGERVRFDLPGNIEPEVFSPDGKVLAVLDFVPPGKPQRYRLRLLDLPTGQLRPVKGAADDTNADRIARVYDARRARLFTLCSREADAIAFVECLDLKELSVRRIMLPAPFGQHRPGVHDIALSSSGERLCVVHAKSAGLVDIDPGTLAIKRVGTFADTGQEGKPNMALTAAGGLIVNVDGRLIVDNPRKEIPTPGPARGLVLGPDNDAWAGHPAGLVHYDLATGQEIRRIAVAGLYILKHVRTA